MSQQINLYEARLRPEREPLTGRRLALAFDLVFAGLIFEYVEPAPLLARCARWLRRGGVLGTALQLPCVAGKVSASAYPSLERLAPVINLVDPARLDEAAAAAGFAPPRRRVAQLPNGKRFALGVHVRA